MNASHCTHQQLAAAIQDTEDDASLQLQGLPATRPPAWQSMGQRHIGQSIDVHGA